MTKKPEPLEWRRWLAALLLALVVEGMIIAFPSQVRAIASPNALSQLQGNLKAAIAKVRPAVVSISAYGIRWSPGPGGEGDRAETATPYRSIGTGVIVDPRGYVLTNAHVVRHASSIDVGLWRAQPINLSGQIIHHDGKKDLALIRLSGAGPYPYATFGRPGAVQVGDWVIAIGSPYGLQHSVSMGIVSDRARNLWIDGNAYRDLIQTDAAINQGNSGGPLINLRGEVVGISTAIYAPNGTSAGIGFAIPADRALTFLTRDGATKAGFLQPALMPSLAGYSQAAAKRAALLENTHRKEPYKHAQSSRPALEVIPRAAAFVLAAAVLFNMLGLGGGFLYVPILLLFGVSFPVASATSLSIIAAAHFSALYVFLRSRLIDYKLAMVLEPVTCIGAFLGGISSNLLGETPLSLMFAGVLFLAGYLMHRNPLSSSQPLLTNSSKWCWHQKFGPHRYAIDLPVGLPIALTIGYLGGMLGFAGGIIKVPMMVILFGVPIKVAIATSSLMVSVTSLVGCVGHGFAGDFDPKLSIALAAAAVIGAQFGSRLTIKADKLVLKRIFAVVLLVMAIWMTGRAI